MAKEFRAGKCPELEFFVHEGSCEGENRKLYPIRITKQNIPQELSGVYLNYDSIRTERQCCEELENDHSHPRFHNENDITLYISNTFDVYYNFTNMTRPWVIGNLRTEEAPALIRRVVEEDTPALNAEKTVTWSELTEKYGNKESERVFSLNDYKIYLFNNWLEKHFG